MAFTKYASFEETQVLDIKGSEGREHTATLDRISDFRDYRTEDGFLYARIRAISSRVNKNHDGWPSVELAGGPDLFEKFAKEAGIPATKARQASFTAAADDEAKYGYSTFLHKPIFVDHNNSNPQRARGVIVDAKFHVEDHKTATQHDSYYESAPDNHMPPVWVELLLEVDAKAFPKLAKAIIQGSKDPDKGIDGFSMGCDVERSVCNICKNSASSPDEYCTHIRMKGAHCDYTDPETGQKTSKRSYEDCYGIKFFEISAVFDPADETALLRELIHEGSTVSMNSLPPQTASLIKQALSAKDYRLLADAIRSAPIQNQEEVAHHFADHLEQTNPNFDRDRFVGAATGEPVSQRDVFNPGGAREHPGPNPDPNMTLPGTTGPVFGSTKTAENPLPQADLLKAPDDIDTLREEAICPVCGSDMDDETCEVCGYVSPPEGFDNPDLQKAEQGQLQREEPDPAQSPTDQLNPGTPPQPSDASNQTSIAHVRSDMGWNVHTPRVAFTDPANETPVIPNKGPVSEEPKEKILEDQTQPTTSHVRTAGDFLAAAGATESRRNMSQKTADAASGAPADAKADVNTDVEGVGGVDQASNEEASKADAQIDVEGQGGTGVEGVAADSTVSVDQGDEHSKNIESIPTKTFDDGSSAVERQADPVGGGTFPESGEGVHSSWQVTALEDGPFPEQDENAGESSGANPGTQPVDSVGRPDERVDVLESVTSPANNSGETKTWSGTDGNGVTQQQEPVTNETLEGEDIVNLRGSSTHIFTAFKLADLEVDLGLIDVSRKYERVAELEGKTPEELVAVLGYAQRVRTAGLSKGVKTATRVPHIPSDRGVGRTASKESSEENSDQVPDAAIFMK